MRQSSPTNSVPRNLTLAKINDEVREAYERYWKAEEAAAENHTVLLVEGEDDRDVLETIFDTSGKTWRSRVRIIAAGSYTKVLEKRILFPHPHVLLDRDTRTDAEVAALKATGPFVWITDGWCLENIFLDPAFVYALSPRAAADLATARERWVRAGALWWTLQRARERGQIWWDKLWASSFGRPRDDFDPGTAATFLANFPCTTTAPIDLEALAHEFQTRLEDILTMSEPDQWRLGVHGKAAFKSLLIPALQHTGQLHRSATSWHVELARRVDRPLPAPLDELLASIKP